MVGFRDVGDDLRPGRAPASARTTPAARWRTRRGRAGPRSASSGSSGAPKTPTGTSPVGAWRAKKISAAGARAATWRVEAVPARRVQCIGAGDDDDARAGQVPRRLAEQAARERPAVVERAAGVQQHDVQVARELPVLQAVVQHQRVQARSGAAPRGPTGGGPCRPARGRRAAPAPAAAARPRRRRRCGRCCPARPTPGGRPAPGRRAPGSGRPRAGPTRSGGGTASASSASCPCRPSVRLPMLTTGTGSRSRRRRPTRSTPR